MSLNQEAAAPAPKKATATVVQWLDTAPIPCSAKSHAGNLKSIRRAIVRDPAGNEHEIKVIGVTRVWDNCDPDTVEVFRTTGDDGKPTVMGAPLFRSAPAVDPNAFGL